MASKMTLGEAIVRGILNQPKYVLSLYSYRKELEKYESCIQTAKSKRVRDVANEYLEALRRALEKADDLDELFQKHIPDPAGKYIVFCASYEHLQKMCDKAYEWFAKVDAAPHVYCVYSDDPQTSRAFRDFKADKSDHLKLLFCIDMLNEGIHVEDISGVILLRLTVSPIIYKQQIGRAMSANKSTNAVIFDIVLNIENLCSIGAIEEEMQVALTYYRSLSQNEAIVNEHFQVIDEVQDCIRLFERLNDTLTASWDVMYQLAAAYYKENGDLDVPKRYVSPEGYSLGSWLNTQRQVRAGKAAGLLTEQQIEKLNAIGMRWESLRDLSWERHLAAARQYHKEHGDLLVSITDRQIGGVALGRWIAQLRSYRKSNIQCAYLTPERIQTLDQIGMVWDVPDYLWEQNYMSALQFHRQHGNLQVPKDCVDENGIRLGAWLTALRKSRRAQRIELTQDQIARLDALGMDWSVRKNTTWDDAYAVACEYHRQHGHLDVPSAYVAAGGIRLGRWIRSQRTAGRTSLSEARRQKLDAIGMTWEPRDPWLAKFALVRRFYEEHGHLRMPAEYVAEGVWLKRWLTEQVARLNEKAGGRAAKARCLSPEQVALLASVGIRRGVSAQEDAWEKQYEQAASFFRSNGHLRIPKSYSDPAGRNLGVWVMNQRKKRVEGKLTPEQIGRLDRIGMVWEMRTRAKQAAGS